MAREPAPPGITARSFAKLDVLVAPHIVAYLAEIDGRAAGNAGFDLGARIAALQASVMGEPIYRRMGYVEVTRYPYLVPLPTPEG